MRFQSRQPEAGSELVLSQLLAREGLRKSDLNCVEAVERSETDLAMAIAAGRADVGLGIEASARQFQLEFKPLIVERFDLLSGAKPISIRRFKSSSAFAQARLSSGAHKSLAAMTLEGSARCISTGHEKAASST